MKDKLKQLTREYSSILAILVMGAVFTVASPYFLTAQNLTNILLQCAALSIAAIGQALIVISGNLDLSIGQCVCFSSVIGAYLMKFMDVNPWVAVVCALLMGCLIGWCNGFLVAYVGLPAFIATLGMQMICQSFAKIITNATPIARLPEDIAFLGRGYLGPIPICVLIMLAFYALIQFIAAKTRFGRNVFAIGGGKEAAYFAGIPTKKYLCATYILGGLLAGVAGVLLMSRLDSVSITNGNQYEFDTLIACVIGGLSTTGGKGKIVGVLFGTIFLIMFFNGMTMLDVDPFYQNAIKGGVLIIAITADVLGNRKRN
ncbi:ABC transporter permease [Diplocloster agilis]|uniref:ABC transporter permease n=1 Tax=Diplocloster agilis TaxID=2850323 RepID=A0A949K452_9FIRM|nr:ABC transporter permease [Diplocloster agilis]MBU9739092.1 ABC transporter permease [Diplocloster agilis]MBU9745685.1 ABC transporter permease [Diplocloster agilis]